MTNEQLEKESHQGNDGQPFHSGFPTGARAVLWFIMKVLASGQGYKLLGMACGIRRIITGMPGGYKFRKEKSGLARCFWKRVGIKRGSLSPD
jgi:hypothetical protein